MVSNKKLEYGSISGALSSDYDASLDVFSEPVTSQGCCCARAIQSIRRSKRTAVAILFIAFMLDLMLLTAVEPILPMILDSINRESGTNVSVVSSTAVGVMNGAKPFTQVIFNPLFGFLVDRYTHNIPMMVGFAFSLSSTLGFAYSMNFYVLLFFRCCQGIGSSLLTISGLSMLSDVYKDPESRGQAMAIGFSGLAVGLVVGFPFGSILYDFVGRETPFLVLCGLIVVGASIRFGLMPIWIQADKTLEPFDDPDDGACCEELTVCTDPYILLTAGVYFFLCYGIGSVMALGPLFLVTYFQAEQWQIGVIFLVGAICQCFLQYTSSICAYRIGWWAMSMMGLLLVGIGMIIYTAVQTLWMILVAQGIFSGGIGLVMGSIPALLGYLADIRARSMYGAVFALSDTGTNLGYFLGSLITGILVSHFEYFHVFAISGGSLCVFSCLCFFLRDVPRKYECEESEEKKPIYNRSPNSNGQEEKRYRRQSTISFTMSV